MASSSTEQHGDEEHGTFDLYDLRVEVVCPPGSRILCGASPGDYFTLQGEMLYLPPGQGFSIYSIGTWCFPTHLRNSVLSAERDATCRGRSPPPRRETTRDRPRRLDDHGCRGCVPRPELCLAPSHNTYRAAAVPSQRNDRNANICYYPRDLMIMVCGGIITVP